ncbi:BLUF domain-containing protein [Erythrobacter sp. AP23]|uniref:BLUF domain-containing protein n=1 Tax=Erythrobacter sp. AP23 TaxID=499656 RepID=UPI00076C17B2|nr:BLUF domain-containing protein [Erythrobacter sp. AP23]KWV93649.1 hypothetical protein ASS64_12135 [Erythrobacter sp. AP23]
MLQRLLYSSKAAPLPTPGEEKALVDEIVAHASQNNRRVGVTGALLFFEGQFIQVLEGPGDVLEDVFERICCDFRHEMVRLLDLQTVPSRIFAEWGMASVVDSENASDPLRAKLGSIPFLAGLNAGEAIRELRAAIDEAQIATYEVAH